MSTEPLRRWAPYLLPAGGLLLLGLAFALRRGSPAVEARPRPACVSVSFKPGDPLVPARVERPPAPAPPEQVASATEQARVRNTFQNYRSAVATRNDGIQAALRPILLRDRTAALTLAQEELDRSHNGNDRDIALRTLESLRR